MDPIHPISPGPPAISRGGVPVERLERISRERDRRHRDELAREGRPPAPRREGSSPEHGEPEPGTPPEQGEGPHIDVRA